MKSIKYSDESLEYVLNYSKRKTLSIIVHPDCLIEIIAPINSSIEKIEDKIKKRWAWIKKQTYYFSNFVRNKEKECVSGETFLYLGKQHLLKVQVGVREEIKISKGKITVYSHRFRHPEHTRKMLSEWYLKKADVLFKKRLEACIRKVSLYIENTDKILEVKIRKMLGRWGSLTKDNIIILNPKLIKASKECIDYVIMHELCHLRYRNHSKKYYDLLENINPKWKKIKDKLESLLS